MISERFIDAMAWLGCCYSTLLLIILAYNLANIIKEDKNKNKQQ
jgi:hypothetical protein